MATTKRVKRVLNKPQAKTEIYLFEAFEEFMMEKQARNLSKSTLRNYRQSFTFFCQYHELDADTPTTAINPSLFYSWINHLKLDRVKETSINHYLRDVRAFMYWCMEEPRNYITPAFKINMIEAQEETIKLFSDDDIVALLEKPKRNDGFVEWRTWAIVNWVLATGNRASTVCEVALTDINFNKKEITLRHTKNKKAQIIPLSSALETVLKEYIRMWRKEAPINGFLFPNIGEEQLTTNALRLSFTRYCNSRGVSQTNIHGLRHNFAKMWVQNNGNMYALQSILGHSSLEMTRRYVRLFGEDLKEDFDKYNPLDNLKRSTKRTQAVKRS